MRKKGAFIAMLIVTVLLLAGCLIPSFIGATSSRSAMCVVESAAIGVFMTGDSYVAPEKTDKKIEERRKKNESFTVPAIYKTVYSFTTEVYEGFEVCYFGKESKEKILYLHGGSYMWQPLVFHYSVCSSLSDRLSAQVIMPVYPKAPAYTYTDVMEWLYRLYGTLDGVKAIIGDSAGGGLSISFSQYLADRGIECPEKIITLSPVLDVTLSNPKIAEYTAQDPMLNREDLARKMASYLGDGDAKDPYASAVYCDFSKLGELTVIVGTRDILYPDAELLHEKLTASGIEHGFFPCENQIHVFGLLPMPERTVFLNLVEKVYFK